MYGILFVVSENTVADMVDEKHIARGGAGKFGPRLRGRQDGTGIGGRGRERREDGGSGNEPFIGGREPSRGGREPFRGGRGVPSRGGRGEQTRGGRGGPSRGGRGETSRGGRGEPSRGGRGAPSREGPSRGGRGPSRGGRGREPFRGSVWQESPFGKQLALSIYSSSTMLQQDLEREQYMGQSSPERSHSRRLYDGPGSPWRSPRREQSPVASENMNSQIGGSSRFSHRNTALSFENNSRSPSYHRPLSNERGYSPMSRRRYPSSPEDPHRSARQNYSPLRDRSKDRHHLVGSYSPEQFTMNRSQSEEADGRFGTRERLGSVERYRYREEGSEFSSRVDMAERGLMGREQQLGLLPSRSLEEGDDFLDNETHLDHQRSRGRSRLPIGRSGLGRLGSVGSPHRLQYTVGRIPADLHGSPGREPLSDEIEDHRFERRLEENIAWGEESERFTSPDRDMALGPGRSFPLDQLSPDHSEVYRKPRSPWDMRRPGMQRHNEPHRLQGSRFEDGLPVRGDVRLATVASSEGLELSQEIRGRSPEFRDHQDRSPVYRRLGEGQPSEDRNQDFLSRDRYMKSPSPSRHSRGQYRYPVQEPERASRGRSPRGDIYEEQLHQIIRVAEEGDVYQRGGAQRRRQTPPRDRLYPPLESKGWTSPPRSWSRESERVRSQNKPEVREEEKESGSVFKRLYPRSILQLKIEKHTVTSSLA